MADFPSYYDPARIGTLFNPDVGRLATEAAAARLPAAARDEQRVQLLLVDCQVDFCHEGGSLYVPGALDDLRRIIEFIFRHAGRISQITCSLDSHLPLQIFHPAWWAGESGAHPPPFTVISAEDVVAGRWRPLFTPTWSLEYLRRLEAAAKKQLVVWPYHVPIGGVGSALDPELWSAVFWHALARQSQPNWVHKGSIDRTEHYSIIQPEVPVPDHPQGQRNQPLLDDLAASDLVFIAGEAASHCVLETVEDLVEEFASRPDVLDRIYVLRDCMTPVRHPEIDFAAVAREQFAAFEARGIHLVDSTGPLPL